MLCRLLNCNALGEIPRLINIAATAHRNVVRQQLQRNHFKQRQQQFACRRHSNQVIGHLGDFFVAFARDRHHASASRLHFPGCSKASSRNEPGFRRIRDPA